MSRALPCRRCKTDRWLKWKCWDESDPENVWWIACESCGCGGPPGPTMREGGEAWNAAQSDTPSASPQPATPEDSPE